MTKIWRQPKETKRPMVNERDFDSCDLSEWDAWDVYAPAMKSKGKVGKKAVKKSKRSSRTAFEVAKQEIKNAIYASLDVFADDLKDRLSEIPLDRIDDVLLNVDDLVGDDVMDDCVNGLIDTVHDAVQCEIAGEKEERLADEGQDPVWIDEICEADVKHKKVAKKRVPAPKEANPLVAKLVALDRLSARDQDGIPVKVCFVGGTDGASLRYQVTDDDGAWSGAVAAVVRRGKLLRVYFDNKGGVHEFSVSKFPPEWTAALACGNCYNLPADAR